LKTEIIDIKVSTKETSNITNGKIFNSICIICRAEDEGIVTQATKKTIISGATIQRIVSIPTK